MQSQKKVFVHVFALVSLPDHQPSYTNPKKNFCHENTVIQYKNSSGHGLVANCHFVIASIQ